MSLLTFQSFYKWLEQRGVTIDIVYFKVIDLESNDIRYEKETINANFWKRLKNYIKNNRNLNKKKYSEVVTPQNLYMTVDNLKKYRSQFRVNVQIGKSPKYLDLKLKDNRQQHIINREIERYKRLFDSLWEKYSIEQRNVIKDLKLRFEYDNYYVPGYAVRGYVTPQE